MSNLANEYRERHKLRCVSVVNEGVLFFEKNNTPFAICIISTYSKASTICDNCSMKTSRLVAEIYLPGSRSHFSSNTLLHSHDHVDPDVDVLAYVKKELGRECEPFIPKDTRDQEKWLWNFYLKDKNMLRLLGKEFKEFRKNLPRNEPCNFISEMMWVAESRPAVMQIFYKKFYSIFLINRMYLLVG